MAGWREPTEPVESTVWIKAYRLHAGNVLADGRVVLSVEQGKASTRYRPGVGVVVAVRRDSWIEVRGHKAPRDAGDPHPGPPQKGDTGEQADDS